MKMDVEMVYDARAELAEGPVWHQGRLYWVNITPGIFNCFDPVEKTNVSRSLGRMVGAAVPCDDGRWLLACQDGFVFFDWNTGLFQPIHDPEAHLPRNRFNDGKCDPAGRFWAGTLNLDEEPQRSALYVLDTDRSVRRVLAPVSLSNGMGWSPDGATFYYIDTPTRQILAFDFDLATGGLSNQRVLVDLPAGPGYPDGMTVDSAGNLWVALWGDHAVICLDGRRGELLRRVDLPVSQPSSCTFGGDRLDEMYVTTARQALTAEQCKKEPFAGALFRVKVGVTGCPATAFRTGKGKRL
jgi:sugar lactone lactonase YvrE